MRASVVCAAVASAYGATVNDAPVLNPPRFSHELGDGADLDGLDLATLQKLVAMYGRSGPSLYGGPENGGFDEWLRSLKADRDSAIKTIHYKGGVFDKVPWTQTNYIQTQMHPFDRFFYDPDTGKYTVDKFLDDLKERYGGVESILLWPTYPQIGVDDRNQFDYYRMMPGGMQGLKELTAELKEKGVRVLWGYQPWENGTRREPKSDEDAMIDVLKATGADGFNGDTLLKVPESFWKSAVRANYPIALEPENGGDLESLNWQTNGWGYWYYSYRETSTPLVDRFKYITQGKWMTHLCERWGKDKTKNLHHAWFNGDGYVAWENVFGIWNGITPRDGEALRRVSHMSRFFGGKLRLLQSPDWVPHTDEVTQEAVYASKWPAYDPKQQGEGDVLNLWTLINTGADGYDEMTSQLKVKVKSDKSRFYDCYAGKELKRDWREVLEFKMEGLGFGCVIEVNGEPREDVSEFLNSMASMTSEPLSSFSSEYKHLQQRMQPIEPTARTSEAPRGAVLIPYAESFTFKVWGTEMEPLANDMTFLNVTDDAFGVNVQFPWEDRPQRYHEHTLSVGPFYMDKFPVTNERYSKYLNETGYVPKDSRAFLKHWKGSATMPPELANKPVTYVSLAEARDFCKWAGGRLPHGWEWQYAAQGTDGRKYPWGNVKNSSNQLPTFYEGNANPGPEAVDAHSPQGNSPFGVADMVGNVWQYTDEFHDDHTRTVILRGGSNYRPSGHPYSYWYFPNKPELDQHNKYFLFDEAFERAGTVGFRCVVDAEHKAAPNAQEPGSGAQEPDADPGSERRENSR